MQSKEKTVLLAFLLGVVAIPLGNSWGNANTLLVHSLIILFGVIFTLSGIFYIRNHLLPALFFGGSALLIFITASLTVLPIGAQQSPQDHPDAWASEPPLLPPDETSAPAPRVTPSPSVDSAPARIQGKNRYETSANIALTWDPGVEQVFLANGEQYLDSLPAAALAASKGMPLLLSGSSHLHSATITAIERLRPQEIIVVGGEEAISLSVETKLRDTDLGPIRRISGGDRYETAALLVDEHERIDSAYIVTDEEFPDALASAAQAGQSPGPILLAKPDHVPRVTLDALNRIDPARTIVVGGREALSLEVEAQLSYASNSLERINGENRYETAALLNQEFGPTQTTLVVASGASFSDALSAAPFAAQVDAAFLLTTPEHVPSITLVEAARIQPNRIVVLGSPAAISLDAEKVLARILQ